MGRLLGLYPIHPSNVLQPPGLNSAVACSHDDKRLFLQCVFLCSSCCFLTFAPHALSDVQCKAKQSQTEHAKQKKKRTVPGCRQSQGAHEGKKNEREFLLIASDAPAGIICMIISLQRQYSYQPKAPLLDVLLRLCLMSRVLRPCAVTTLVAVSWVVRCWATRNQPLPSD